MAGHLVVEWTAADRPGHQWEAAKRTSGRRCGELYLNFIRRLLNTQRRESMDLGGCRFNGKVTRSRGNRKKKKKKVATASAVAEWYLPSNSLGPWCTGRDSPSL